MFCAAGKRARRFVAATSPIVIRAAERITSAPARLACVAHTHPLVAAGAREHEPGAISRRAERRRPPTSLVHQGARMDPLGPRPAEARRTVFHCDRGSRATHLVLAPADVGWESCALQPRQSCESRSLRTRHATRLPASPSSGGPGATQRAQSSMLTTWIWWTSEVGGRRDAEHADVLRSRKARPAIRRGDFPHCDPRG
jgi:hypothetical protein